MIVKLPGKWNTEDVRLSKGFGMNMTKLGISQLTVALIVAGLTTLVSSGQEIPPDAAQSQPAPLGPGDHTRSLTMGEQKRSYLVHVPQGCDPKKPAPVVLALHGAAMNGPMMVWFSGLNKKADEAGFVVV